jgi:hypothetical protein
VTWGNQASSINTKNDLNKEINIIINEKKSGGEEQPNQWSLSKKIVKQIKPNLTPEESNEIFREIVQKLTLDQPKNLALLPLTLSDSFNSTTGHQILAEAQKIRKEEYRVNVLIALTYQIGSLEKHNQVSFIGLIKEIKKLSEKGFCLFFKELIDTGKSPGLQYLMDHAKELTLQQQILLNQKKQIIEKLLNSPT